MMRTVLGALLISSAAMFPAAAESTLEGTNGVALGFTQRAYNGGYMIHELGGAYNMLTGALLYGLKFQVSNSSTYRPAQLVALSSAQVKNNIPTNVNQDPDVEGIYVDYDAAIEDAFPAYDYYKKRGEVYGIGITIEDGTNIPQITLWGHVAAGPHKGMNYHVDDFQYLPGNLHDSIIFNKDGTLKDKYPGGITGKPTNPQITTGWSDSTGWHNGTPPN